jgi:hypothetical protein
MKRFLLTIAVAIGVAQVKSPQQILHAPVPENVWKSATELPNIDFTGLTPDQKLSVLKLLREESCTCGCGMKMAQCRMQDPKCAFSKMSANAAVASVKSGKTPDEMRKAALAENHLKTLEDLVKIPIEGAPSKGPIGAKITLVEFSDFQCPFCSIAAVNLDQLLRAHPADIRLVYKQYPIALVHKSADLAARASLAANQQGKFWPLHDLMFNNHDKLSRQNILAWAMRLNMDMAKFTKDMDSQETENIVLRNIAEGDDIGVLGTPTVFLNGHRYNGELTVADLGKVIDQELKK